MALKAAFLGKLISVRGKNRLSGPEAAHAEAIPPALERGSAAYLRPSALGRPQKSTAYADGPRQSCIKQAAVRDDRGKAA